MTRKAYITTLALVFGSLWAVLAISPHDRSDWALENLLLLAGVGVLVATRRVLPLSNASYGMLFLFLCLHAVGAHYTYSLVPLDDALRSVSGTSLNEVLGATRNHYDRAVHFLFGVLALPPL